MTRHEGERDGMQTFYARGGGVSLAGSGRGPKLGPLITGPAPDIGRMLASAAVCTTGFTIVIWLMATLDVCSGLGLTSLGCSESENNTNGFFYGAILLFLVPIMATFAGGIERPFRQGFAASVAMGIALLLSAFVLPGTSAVALGLGVGAAMSIPATPGRLVPIRIVFALAIALAFMWVWDRALWAVMPFVVLIPDAVAPWANRRLGH